MWDGVLSRAERIWAVRRRTWLMRIEEGSLLKRLNQKREGGYLSTRYGSSQGVSYH